MMEKRYGKADVWIVSRSDGVHEVRYARYMLAKFVSKSLAEAYRDWFWARRGVYLNDTRLGRFSMEELISARKVRSWRKT